MTRTRLLGFGSALVIAGMWGGCYFDPWYAWMDADHDGYDESWDCADDNASIRPGAQEQCSDGIDNNCDGAIDSADSECDFGGTGGSAQGGNGPGGSGFGNIGNEGGGGSGGAGGSGGSGGAGGAGGSGGSGGVGNVP